MAKKPMNPQRVGRFWLFDNGRRLPVVSGGADEDGDGDGGSDDGDAGDSGSGSDGDGDESQAGRRGGGLPDDPAALQRMIGDLRKENANHRTKNKELEPLAEKARKLEEEGKSETQRLSEQASASDARADAAEAQSLRYEVAAASGIPLDQAHRLVGSSKEELEGDAETLSSLFANSSQEQEDPDSKESTSRPREKMRGGGAMNSGRTAKPDMRKVVADIPR